MADLLLDRYEKVKTLKKTKMKSIELYNNRNTGQKIVAKIQPGALLKDSKIRNVLHEASFTQGLQGYRGIPSMIWSGRTKDQRIVLLVEELGQSLTDRLQICNGKFSVKTACMLGIQMIQIVKTIHDKGFVISNVSMDLFQFGKGQKALNLCINDLGQCLTYRDNKTLAHILTPRQYFRNPCHIFQSEAVYTNVEKSRKDDIESIILIIVFMIKGSLPWSSTFKKQAIYKPTSQTFLSNFLNSNIICDGCPKIVLNMLEDCRSLKFQDEPPYHWYLLKLKSLLFYCGEDHDFVFDWMLSREYVKYEAVAIRNPNIVLDKDNDFLGYLEREVFPYIDADQINTKYNILYLQRNESDMRSKQSGISHQKLPSEHAEVILSFQKSEQQKEQVKQSPNKKQQKREQKLNNSILERKKKKKQQCFVM